jgi:hypothetical protein
MRCQQRIALGDRDQATADRGGDEGGSWFPACRASFVRHRFARPQV